MSVKAQSSGFRVRGSELRPIIMPIITVNNSAITVIMTINIIHY